MRWFDIGSTNERKGDEMWEVIDIRNGKCVFVADNKAACYDWLQTRVCSAWFDVNEA